jgi:DNA segregation ATPase FtsK/SpoIIIE, S-DNA-T family
MALSDRVRLTVSEVRQKIFEASETPAQGLGSRAGMLFHRTLEAALREDHPAFWQKSLDESLDAEAWAATLYDRVLGPELTRSQAALRDNGAEVLALWRGVRGFTRWFCGLLAEAVDKDALRFDGIKEAWVGAESMFQAECDLAVTLQEPNWTAAVEIAGRADHLIRVADKRWCVAEFKLGEGHAEADAAQLCLYHCMLDGHGSAALVRFGVEDDAKEIRFASEWIGEAQPKLLNLIGALAGVIRTEEPIHPWPRPAGEKERDIGKRLLAALREFGADAELHGDPLVGPTFLRFLLQPRRGVNARRIVRQGEDIQVRLNLEHEPIIGVVNGRIAVDVQRPDREFISFESLRPELEKLRTAEGNSRVLAGMDLRGTVHFIDLAHDSAHLLVGGVPGSGKSEWLRSAVAGLLVTNRPERLRLALVDPKKNAFPELAGSPYLWKPDSLIDAPEGRIIPLLEDLIEEMDKRNDLLKQAKANDLADYCRKTKAGLPRIVCIVDEFADLLMSGRRAERAEVEQGFIRIAQIGRAAGVHLILATQLPRRQVVSGNLKGNILSRLAFRVSNRTESQILIDQNGAENLLGKGDLLLAAGGSNLVRLQSAYLSDRERERIFAG